MPELHTLLTGLAFGESPRWHDGRLWFSDFGAQEVRACNMDHVCMLQRLCRRGRQNVRPLADLCQ